MGRKIDTFAMLFLPLLLFIAPVFAIPIHNDVQVDRLAQLVTTHYQYEHLDPIIAQYASELAKQLEFHDIQIAPGVEDPPTLRAQVIQAIQSHVENRFLSSVESLPSTRDTIVKWCPPTEHGTVPASCLLRHAEALSSELDQFVETQWKTWIAEKTEQATTVEKLNDNLVSVTVARSKMDISLPSPPCESHFFTRYIDLALVD
ncbi:hypothetical protein BJV82DRAFT_662589 [Fennellomyces sp. T-0311]|nr:hypothetical protein BJV82DRAFT_662589 [Fennellomyces sp. T-0311]